MKRNVGDEGRSRERVGWWRGVKGIGTFLVKPATASRFTINSDQTRDGDGGRHRDRRRAVK